MLFIGYVDAETHRRAVVTGYYFLRGSRNSLVGPLRSLGRFLRVEPIWLSLQPGRDGWNQVERTIDTLFQTHEKVIIESLGAGEGFHRFHAAPAKKYSIKLIRVVADLDICLARVKSRSRADQIAVSDDQVREYNQIASGMTYDWDLEIDNNGPAADADIIGAILSMDRVEKK